jgi:L,D-peptidoglycan transpeptidase YkuD (ErfK/YbiS/YcfS/YnhG family)
MNLIVRPDGAGAVMDWGAGPRRCAIGPAGIAPKRREGDGITPQGVWPVREIFYRPDRGHPLQTLLPQRALARDDGWCDAPDDPHYNRLVKLPYPASAETMWRADHLYDLVAVLGFNDAPVVAGAGSAIFLHLVQSAGESRSDQHQNRNYAPTAGCVALARADLVEALEQLQPGEAVVIG